MPTTPVTGTFYQATQPISATILPLPTGAATAANQATMATNQTGGSQKTQIVDGSGNVIGSTSNALNVSLPSATVTTLTPPSNTGYSTSANQTNGTQQAKITDGTTVANVSPSSGSQTGQNAVEVAPTFQVVTLSATTASTSSVIDAGGYRAINLQINTSYTGLSSITWQGSNDNSNWQSFALNLAVMTGGNSPVVNASSTANQAFHGNLPFRYFRIVWAGTGTSGTSQIVCDFVTMTDSTQPGPVAQSGTWTVQQGSTPSTTPWLTTNTASAAGGYTYSHLAANATTTVKSGAGTLHAIVINTQGATDTITMYDNTAGSGTVIGVINDGSTSAVSIPYDIAFATGLTLVVAGTTSPDITVSYK
jgi:hypothetical protein